MDSLQHWIEFALQVDRHLMDLISRYHTWTYLILFLIVFVERGFIVAAFLPGDSLLFATGAILAHPESGLNIFLLGGVLILAATLGDGINYLMGRYVDPKAFRENSRILKKAYLERTRSFYRRCGSSTLIYARFVPVVRIIAPFVAGVGRMEYQKFILYDLLGATAWVVFFLVPGYFFGQLPIVKEHFMYAILVIMLLSVLVPVLNSFLRKKRPISAKRSTAK